MLSRHAEHLYWVGRYVERADDNLRLGASLYHGMTAVGSLGDPHLAEHLLGVLGAPKLAADAPPPTMQDAVSWCVIDADNPSSVTSCLRAARENIRRARETIGLELWEILSRATMELDWMSSRQAPLEDYLRSAPWWTRAFFGVLDAMTSRDRPYSMMRLGIFVERADMTLRLLTLGADHLPDDGEPQPYDTHFWTILLRACAALDAYRRRSGGRFNVSEIAALLLRDVDCPRSLLYSLSSAERVIAGQGEPARLLGQLRSEVEFRAVDQVLENGSQTFSRMLGECARVHDAIISEWMRPAERL